MVVIIVRILITDGMVDGRLMEIKPQAAVIACIEGMRPGDQVSCPQC